MLKHADRRRQPAPIYAHHHPEHMKRAKTGLSAQIATIGAASNPLLAAMAQSDPEALKGAAADISTNGWPETDQKGTITH
jgi:hypothetical protein